MSAKDKIRSFQLFWKSRTWISC